MSSRSNPVLKLLSSCGARYIGETNRHYVLISVSFGTKIPTFLNISMLLMRCLSVGNGKYEPLRDGETNVLLCETETFWGLWIARPSFRLQNGFAKKSRLRDVQNRSKNETARPWSFNKFLRDLFETSKHVPNSEKRCCVLQIILTAL